MAKEKKTEKSIKPEKKKKAPLAKKTSRAKAEKTEKIKEPKVVVKEKEKEVPKINYFYAVGRRKSSIAQVKIYSVSSQEARFEINSRELASYFPIKRLQLLVLSPLTLTGQEGKFKILVKISGGGISGQAQAVCLGLARALVVFNEDFRRTLKDNGLLKRDSRKVERKKPGLKKARRSPQWAKR